MPWPVSAIRGSNYLLMPAMSDNLHLAWLPPRGASPVSPVANVDGYFSVAHLRSDLDKLRYAGINNIRLWGSMVSWLTNTADYMAVLGIVAQECHARQITITYVMWNGIAAGLAATGGLLDSKDAIASAASVGPLTALWLLNLGWAVHANYPTGVPAGEKDLTHLIEPLKRANWMTQGYFINWPDSTLRARVTAYVQAMATFFSRGIGLQAFQSYDLYNEADQVYDGTVDPYINNFIRVNYDLIAAIHPDPAVTVGWSGDTVALSQAITTPQTEDSATPVNGVPLTYLSMHSYDRSGAFFAALLAAVAAGNRQGRGVVVSEFYDAGADFGQAASYLAAMAAFLNVGGQIWCYIRNNAYRAGGVPFDGIINPTPVASQVVFNSPIGYDTLNNADDNAVRAWTGV